jgi:hypothetical protein
MQVPTATRRIFISYRRSDTQGYAGWLNQVLEEQFGRSNVFRDLDSIAPGEHFPTKVARTIAACTDVFVLIGHTWLGTAGGSRLGDHDDWVRLELEAALRRGLRIVPLLIGSARLPPREALPPSLHPLCDRQAFELRDAHFAEDVRSVISETEQVSAVDRDYLGTAALRRDDRFAELVRLWGENGVGPSAHNIRQQFNTLIDVLEPDERLANVAPGTVTCDSEYEDSLRGTLRSMRDTSFSGIIALTPRRLVYVPRRNSLAPTVVPYRDIIDVRPARFLMPLVLVLAHDNVNMSWLSGSKKRFDAPAYIRDRIGR